MGKYTAIQNEEADLQNEELDMERLKGHLKSLFGKDANKNTASSDVANLSIREKKFLMTQLIAERAMSSGNYSNYENFVEEVDISEIYEQCSRFYQAIEVLENEIEHIKSTFDDKDKLYYEHLWTQNGEKHMPKVEAHRLFRSFCDNLNKAADDFLRRSTNFETFVQESQDLTTTAKNGPLKKHHTTFGKIFNRLLEILTGNRLGQTDSVKKVIMVERGLNSLNPERKSSGSSENDRQKSPKSRLGH